MKDKKAKYSEQYFVSHITYIKTRERTHYLPLVTDTYSRKIMGYHFNDDMNAENVVKALQMTNTKRTTLYTIQIEDCNIVHLFIKMN